MAKSEIHKLMDEKRNPEEQKKAFAEAEKNKDFTKMYDILFHSSCQYLKKVQGKYWSWDRIVDAANDMTIFIMRRYEKDPNHHEPSHIAAVYFVYKNVVQYHYKHREDLDKKCCSYEKLKNY